MKIWGWNPNTWRKGKTAFLYVDSARICSAIQVSGHFWTALSAALWFSVIIFPCPPLQTFRKMALWEHCRPLPSPRSSLLYLQLISLGRYPTVNSSTIIALFYKLRWFRNVINCQQAHFRFHLSCYYLYCLDSLLNLPFKAGSS